MLDTILEVVSAKTFWKGLYIVIIVICDDHQIRLMIHPQLATWLLHTARKCSMLTSTGASRHLRWWSICEVRSSSCRWARRVSSTSSQPPPLAAVPLRCWWTPIDRHDFGRSPAIAPSFLWRSYRPLGSFCRLVLQVGLKDMQHFRYWSSHYTLVRVYTVLCRIQIT